MEFTKEQMTAQCAWCRKIIRIGVKGAPITHTICPECERKTMADLEWFETVEERYGDDCKAK